MSWSIEKSDMPSASSARLNPSIDVVRRLRKLRKMNCRGLPRVLAYVLPLLWGCLWLVPAQACQPLPKEYFKTPEEQLAEAELAVSGYVLERIDNIEQNRFTAIIRVEQRIKGASPDELRIQDYIQVPCRHVRTAAAGEWWTLLLRRTEGEYFVSEYRTFCAPGYAPAGDAPAGHCRGLSGNPFQVGQLTVAAGSEVVLGPDRKPASLWSAVLGAGSSFRDIALPSGTVTEPHNSGFVVPTELRIGPIQIRGRVRFGFVDGVYYATKIPEGDGDLTLHGADAHQVSFSMPGPRIKDALFAKPVNLLGYIVTDYAHFSPEGELTEFRAGADQTIAGIKARKCDNVRLDGGKPWDYPFYNPCRGRRSSDLQTPPKQPFQIE